MPKKEKKTKEGLPFLGIEGGKQNRRSGGRRSGISAESISIAELSNEPTRVIEKSDEDRKEISNAIETNFLFTSLDDRQLKVVLDAMEAKTFKAGDTIIEQGDDGDDFYVVSHGTCNCYVTDPKQPKEPRLVKVYNHGEAFGELALMYNSPRAATITAVTDCKLWAMDRRTFRTVLLGTTSTKRSKYEGFLTKVPLLASLDKYDRAKIADALVEMDFKDGAKIIEEGDVGNSFYILSHGNAAAIKAIDDSGEPREVMSYQPGDFFGELALLTSRPRAATVVAQGECTCVSLDRASFRRLLGPCDTILRRSTSNYGLAEQRLKEEKPH